MANVQGAEEWWKACFIVDLAGNIDKWSIICVSFLKDFGRTVDCRNFSAAWVLAKQVQAASWKLLPWLF